MLLCIFSCTAFTQAKSGIENYNLLSQGNEYVWMPVAHYQSKKGIYTELRYNYEDVQTVSLYGGKTFGGGKALKFTIIPMVGISVGKFSGVSLATNADAEWKKFYLSSQTQYSIATKAGVDDFFFSWSELGYSLSDNFFGGVAIQYTLQQGSHNAEPGFVAGLNLNNVSIPVYIFSPFKTGRYFVVGLNYEFDFKKKQ
jgi:hypothetical protein